MKVHDIKIKFQFARFSFSPSTKTELHMLVLTPTLFLPKFFDGVLPDVSNTA
jgi:hypothetical protein